MTAEISHEALLERCGAVLREVVERYARTSEFLAGSWLKEARAIVALLPKPVDPDLIEARDVAGDAMAAWTRGGQTYATGLINAIRSGADDDNVYVRAALAGIRRGRELAKARAGEGSGE